MMEKETNDLTITVFTDPLCCWSWAFDAHLRQLKNTLGGQASWKYCMGGLIPSWENFHDSVNNISRPAQMGPVWMHAGQVADQPIAHQLWINDPPASSYPACIAIKCAGLQSAAAEEVMLLALREAAIVDGKNIARQEVLFEYAGKVTDTCEDFNLARFKQDFFNDKGADAFRSDLAQVSGYRINRFPALIIKSAGSTAIIVDGYRQYEDVLKAIESVAAIY